VSITRGNSGNGALPTRGSEQAENQREVGRVTNARVSRPLFGNDRFARACGVAARQTQSRDENKSRLTSLPARQLYLSQLATITAQCGR
jgi:hypothetical protein